MGGGSWTSQAYATYSKSANITRESTVNDLFRQRSIYNDFHPKQMKNMVRESRDFEGNPASPIQFYLDGTGSMGSVLEYFAKTGLNNLVTSIYEKKPVENPQVMLGIIGDVHAHDSYPFQITQFEADIRIAEQLSKLYFERGGGGNGYESYSLAYYMAAFHTQTDAFDKRQEKGFLFTVGDEGPTADLEPRHIETIFGTRSEKTYSTQELYNLASEKFNCYHIVIAEGSFCRSVGKERVVNQWAESIGRKNVVLLEKVEDMAEVVSAIIQVQKGFKKDDVINSFDGQKRETVKIALQNLEEVIGQEHYW